MFEQTVQLSAVQRAPGAVEVVSGLRLLPRVVVVLELQEAEAEFNEQTHGQVQDCRWASGDSDLVEDA